MYIYFCPYVHNIFYIVKSYSLFIHTYIHVCMRAYVCAYSEMQRTSAIDRLDGADTKCLCPSFNCQAELSLSGRIL